MVAEATAPQKLKPLKITCTSTDCDRDLHCFRQKKRAAFAHGPCRSCGQELIDWPRVHRRSLRDAEHTFAALQVERIRHHFWHLELDQRAINHARRKGAAGMAVAATQRIRKAVGPATPTFDGRQTPRNGNVLFYAQHATGSCCRTCIQEWHGIPKGRALTPREMNYLSALLMEYVRHRMPDLGEQGQKVPPIRGKQLETSRR
jgi:hypothetical protein